jgi:hypothetical protein
VQKTFVIMERSTVSRPGMVRVGRPGLAAKVGSAAGSMADPAAKQRLAGDYFWT